MNLNTLLYVIIGASVLLFLVTLVILQIVNRKSRREGSAQMRQFYSELTSPNKSQGRQLLFNFFLKSYVYFMRIPLLSGYTMRIRKRLSSIHSYDEFTMRKETMKITYLTLCILLAVVIALLLINRDPSFLAVVFLAIVVTNGLLVDTFVNRVEDRLLRQLAHLMADVRHHYHQHGMVEEAIYEAAQLAKYEASLHAERIYDVLTSNDPEEELENYYEVAPNRFLKGFAGISYLTKEYGDKVIQNGSMYLNSLSRLTNEINMEVLRREKLNYLFKGLTMISVAPVLFTKPIEIWAKGHFPVMSDFYTGKMGFITKMVIFAVIWLSYVLLRKMQENDEGKYAAKANRPKWEKKIYEWPPVRWVVDRIVPGAHTKQYFQLSRLLKDTNSPLTLEWLYLQRILLCLVSFIAVVSVCFYLHHLSVQNVLTAPTENAMLFGSASAKDEKKAQEITTFDTKIIERVKGETDHVALRQKIAQAIGQAPKDSPAFKSDQRQQDSDSEALINQSTNRILAKIDKMNAEYFKWWELLVALAISVFGYAVPLWLLFFQQRLRQMDMQNEVDQFHAIIAMLCEIERISVENILEWMERFALVFRTPLQDCLLNYEAGAWQALDQLKEDAPYVPFVRTVERLQLAVERIPIREAFDDLETERVYYQEQRKEQNERIIAEKSSWGKMIGFVPLYALVFLYLVIPLIYMSMTQMSKYFNQIKSIT